MMKSLNEMVDELCRSKDPDWLIVHRLAGYDHKGSGLIFPFVDGPSRRDQPFGKHQGYISCADESTRLDLEVLLLQKAREYKSDHAALANVFILITRFSSTDDQGSALTTRFTEVIGPDRCRIVFDLLIASLNCTYRAQYRRENPTGLDEWLDLFRASEYDLPFSDPLLDCLALVRTGISVSLGLDVIEKMNATLRSVLFGAFAYQLDVPKAELDRFLANGKELAFVAACLIDKNVPKDPCPEWLDTPLVKKILFEHWRHIGAAFLRHTYGLSYRNSPDDPLYNAIRGLHHECLNEQIHKEDLTKTWFNEVHFPYDFISIFSWMAAEKVDLDGVPKSTIAIILDRFVIEFMRLVADIPISLADSSSSDQLKTFQLHEPKYLNALVYLHYLSVHFTQANQKALKQICFDVKRYYYGGYAAVQAATRFTELLLLIGLPLAENGFPADHDDKGLKTFLKTLADTLLVSYFHLSERQEDLWNPQSETGAFNWTFGRATIHEILNRLGPISPDQLYFSVIQCREEVCIA